MHEAGFAMGSDFQGAAPRIRVLPPALVNRIAAGECVERPASVVKELVENALDSGATKIDVVIQDGGRALIQVSDDGAGMSAEDLPLAIHPHATSKIRDDDDLFNIQTMGFRGEALASIGSVARLTITSRRRESDVAWSIQVDAGAATAPTPCNAPPGTTVQVRDLFHCVPARRKFLKTTATESGHVGEQMARIALAYPHVAFTLRSDKRLTHDLPVTDSRQQRISDFFGPELGDVLIPIERLTGDVRVAGLVVPPQEARGSSKWEYVFVNGRYVRDRFVSHAVREAYRSLVDPSKYPVAFLWIELPPDQVDVNVHPSKIEVRWRDSNFVHAQVLAAIREQFLMRKLDHRFRAPGESDGDAERERVRQAMVDFFRGGGAAAAAREARTPYLPAASERFEAHQSSSEFAASPATADRSFQTRTTPDGGPVDRSSEFEPHVIPAGPQISPAVPTEPVEASSGAAAWRAPLAALQVHNTYLVVQTADGIMLIDQHALHERILYEQLRRRIAERALESQRLLLPEAVSVPPDRMEALESHAETLARLGIELTQSGPQSVTLHAFPSFLHRIDRGRFVRDLLDLLAQPGVRPAADTLLHKLLDMMACKAAVKAGDPLTTDEIAALLAQRETAERSSHCPHGRPTTIHFTLLDLEKMFRRR